MPLRRLTAAAVIVMILAGLMTALYIAQTACPPPSWAFWRFTGGSEPGRVNVACVGRD